MKTLKLLIVVFLVVLLAGCSAAATPMPAPTATLLVLPTTPATTTVVPTLAPTATEAPTVDATGTYDAIAKSIQATNAVAVTSTPLATNTLAATAIPVAKATATLIPWTATPPVQANCEIVSTTVVGTGNNSTLVPNAPFDARWEVKNTSSSDWTTGDADLAYISGEKMQTKADTFDLASNVASGATFTFIVDMKAPAKIGNFSATWGIFSGGKKVCNLPMRVAVK